MVVLLGYAVNGERTLEEYYERLLPFADTFMALFGRDRLLARSTLSRFLAALPQAPVEALRTVFLEDLLARPLEQEEQTGGLWDRQETHWLVFDSDGTRQAARQRALPCTPDLPPAGRRLDEVCASGYTGRKRGEVVRTRTTLLQAHTHQWIGTFSGTSGAGNGDYRGELRQAVKAIRACLQAQSVPLSRAAVRLDGQYGNGAVVADLSGLAYIMRGKDYDLLNLPEVQTRLAQPADQQTTHPETVPSLIARSPPDSDQASLRLREPYLTIAGQREQSGFKAHDRLSSPLSSSRYASRGRRQVQRQPIVRAKCCLHRWLMKHECRPGQHI